MFRRDPIAHPVISQTSILRRQSPEQRLRTAAQLLRLARRVKRAALRAQHTDWTDRRLDREVARIFLHAGT